MPTLTDIDSRRSISRAVDEGDLLEDSALHAQLLGALRAPVR